MAVMACPTPTRICNRRSLAPRARISTGQANHLNDRRLARQEYRARIAHDAHLKGHGLEGLFVTRANAACARATTTSDRARRGMVPVVAAHIQGWRWHCRSLAVVAVMRDLDRGASLTWRKRGHGERGARRKYD
jgi:hypothetical protein